MSFIHSSGRIGSVLVAVLVILASSQAQGAITLIDEDFAGFGNTENYSGVVVSWSDSDHTAGFERYNLPSGARHTDADYDHDDNAATAEIPVPGGGLEVNDDAGNMTLTGSFTMPASAVQFDLGLLADSRGGVSHTSTVELFNVTKAASILPLTNIVYDTSPGGPDWKVNRLSFTGSLDDAGDTVELRFHATGNGGQGLQLGFVNLTAAVPEPTTLLVWSLLAGLGVVLGWRRRK
jgi:hypothetical protein